MMPDGNLLIAFKWIAHEHHGIAKAFFKRHAKVVTCPITELNLVRVLTQMGHTPSEADRSLADFVAKHRHRLLAADLSATVIAGLSPGHRTTTDCYLAMLAQTHNVKIATLDRAFANRFAGVVEFVA
jgi:toxin-antitoxin system PIN domain toxin